MKATSYDYSSGSRFGCLTIIRDARKMEYGGRLVTAYWCRCDCGHEELLPRTLLLQRQRKGLGCKVCIRGRCVICGTPVPEGRKHNTCSDECNTEKSRRTQNKCYALRARSPEFCERVKRNRKRREAELQATSPEVLEERKKRARASHKKSHARPEARLREKERQARRYRENREAIQASRRAFLASLTPEELAERRESWQKSWRESARRKREAIYSNPHLYAAHRKSSNERHREDYNKRKQEEALGELLRESQVLIEKIKE